MDAGQNKNRARRDNEVSETELIWERNGSVVAEEASLTGEEESYRGGEGTVSQRSKVHLRHRKPNNSQSKKGTNERVEKGKGHGRDC